MEIMKFKTVYVATVYGLSTNGPKLQIQPLREPKFFAMMGDACAYIDLVKATLYDMQQNIKVPGILDVVFDTREYRIDVDQFNDYNPDYEVDIAVTYTKRISVVVSGEDAVDEDQAEEYAIREVEDGKWDSNLRDVDYDDFEVRAFGVSTIHE